MSVDGVRRCGVLGSPIAHSLSPILHRAAYAELGLDWSYDAYDVGKNQLAGFVEGLTADWRGLSLTMPLKREVIGLLDEVEPLARTLQSVNTVLLEATGRKVGYNTDVAGLVSALGSNGVLSAESVVVLGGGATAASAVAAARHLGARRVDVLVRTPGKSAWLHELGAELGTEVQVGSLDQLSDRESVDLVITTVPGEAQPPLADAVRRLDAVVLDVIYHPWPTPFAVQGAGTRVIGGFDLLLHQAGRQVELMAEVAAAPLDAMRVAGLAALGHPG